MSKKYNMTPEGSAKLAEAVRIRNIARTGQPCSESRRENIRKSRMGHSVSEEARRKIGEAQKGENNFWYGTHGPNYGNVGPMLGKKHSEETKRVIAEKRKFQVTTEETRRKMSESRTGSKNPNWIGGASEYCNKFHSGTLRNRVRAFFENRCQLCGQLAGDETLHVHHVYYNKKACCEVSEDGKYYSDLGIKGGIKSFEIIGDPNKFVPLHNKCHSKTTAKNQREHYARHFEKVINEQHEGACYYTEEEYAGLCGTGPST